jgi:dGTPase
LTDILALAPCACHAAASRGRRHAEAPAPTRSDYQRDRDRIVHSSAFRRLVYKTQVFLNHEGDLFRTRLTHSLEVAQLARSVARSLRLNEDLVEAIALAHDLGHTPFGHAGQDALNACMQAYGGFEHNLQSLRVVDALELRYPQFAGLNLTYETREGILKHCSRSNAELLEAQEPGGVASRFLLRQQPSLEAQLANLADEIAYNAHDIDDGVRSGLITQEQLAEVPLFARYRSEALDEFPGLDAPATERRLLYEAIRRMLSAQVYDVIAATQQAIACAAPGDVDAVRRAGPPGGVRTGDAAAVADPQAVSVRQPLPAPAGDRDHGSGPGGGARVVRRLPCCAARHEASVRRPRCGGAAGSHGARVVADFIAGMTDRFAAAEHERLTGRRLLP